MIFQIVIKDGFVIVGGVVDTRVGVGLHLAICVLVLLVSHEDGVAFLLDFYDLLDVAVVEFGVERVNRRVHFGHFGG